MRVKSYLDEYINKNHSEVAGNIFKNHYVAITANKQLCKKHNFSEKNIFTFMKTLPGRFSVISPVNLINMFELGIDNYKKIIDFLILSNMCPRSIFYAVDKIQYHLGRLTQFYKSDNAANRNVQIIHKGFVNSNAEQIIDFGLHEFLTKFIDDMSTTYSDLEEVYFLGTDR
jgi:hypothetical protein